MQTKLVSTLKTSPVKFEDYINDQIPERRWAVVYVGGKTFFITDEERKQFLEDVGKGKTIVQVGLLTLTSRFSYIYAIKDRPFKREFEISGDNTVIEKSS